MHAVHPIKVIRLVFFLFFWLKCWYSLLRTLCTRLCMATLADTVLLADWNHYKINNIVLLLCRNLIKSQVF